MYVFANNAKLERVGEAGGLEVTLVVESVYPHTNKKQADGRAPLAFAVDMTTKWVVRLATRQDVDEAIRHFLRCHTHYGCLRWRQRM